jgi:tetratricopeptide (TPR) repeat protein
LNEWLMPVGVAALTWVVLVVGLWPLMRLPRVEYGIGSRAHQRCFRWMLSGALVIGMATLLTGSVPLRTSMTTMNAALERSTPAQSRNGEPQSIEELLARARQYMSQGAVREAIVQYIKVLSIDHRNSEAYTYLGYMQYMAGHLKDARWAVGQALIFDPRNMQARYLRGRIAFGGGRTKKAAEDFCEYLRQAPLGAYRADVKRLLGAVGERCRR